MSRIMATTLNRRNALKARGASALEYALLVIILVVGLVVFFRNFGDSVATEAKTSATTITDNIAATSSGANWNP